MNLVHKFYHFTGKKKAPVFTKRFRNIAVCYFYKSNKTAISRYLTIYLIIVFVLNNYITLT